MQDFDIAVLKNLYKPSEDSSGEDNGQVTIIGGSELFHGAPLLSLKTASRIVDIVFFSSPDKSVGKVAEKLKSELLTFIWVPWEDTEKYIEKSDAVLIGPGFMSYGKEGGHESLESKNYDQTGKSTREITKKFLTEFPDKRWVIDAGSLQTMNADWIPEGAILTPNRKEFEMLFGEDLEVLRLPLVAQDDKVDEEIVSTLSNKHNCTIVLKGPETVVCSPEECVKITIGNAGLTKGGTGDVLAGLTAAFYAKNEAFLAASAASYIAKAAADELFQEKSTYYNAEDLAERIPFTFASLV